MTGSFRVIKGAGPDRGETNVGVTGGGFFRPSSPDPGRGDPDVENIPGGPDLEPELGDVSRDPTPETRGTSGGPRVPGLGRVTGVGPWTSSRQTGGRSPGPHAPSVTVGPTDTSP